MSRLRDQRDEDEEVDEAELDDVSERSEDAAEIEMNEDFESEDKSDTEQELERLVFGDSAGFREGLREFNLEDGEEGDAEASTSLGGLEDAALFFTDLAGDGTQGPTNALDTQHKDDDTLKSRFPSAWEDSDDERIMVSLATVSKLRKLRVAEGEDVISGKEYSKRLRRQFETVNPRPTWAVQAMKAPARKKRRVSRPDGEADNASDDEAEFDEDALSSEPLSRLLQDAESLVQQSGPGAGKKRKLRPEVIDIQRARDIGEKQPSIITSLAFHPRYPLLLSSGPSSTLFLHHIQPSPPAPTPNPLLTSMHVRGNPLNTTAFHPSDDRIFLSSPRAQFFVWNLNTGQVEKVRGQASQEQKSIDIFRLSPDGNYMAILGTGRKAGGVVNILSAKSLQWISQVRIESRNGIADFCWWKDSRGMTIAGKNGEVSEWSMQDQRVIARWRDEGAVGTTVIGLGGQHEHKKSAIGTDRWIAIGSSSGIVNIYDRRVWLASPPTDADGQPVPIQPTPTKTFDHLTTPISDLTFSPDGQILAMSSRWKNDALKLVHLPTCTVFRNWPTSNSPLGRVSAIAFASGSRVGGDLHSLMAVGSEQGKIRLWEIR